jgi:RHS repeat-associated protein
MMSLLPRPPTAGDGSKRTGCKRTRFTLLARLGTELHYDGYQRRWRKQYPASGVYDEYFYDTGHTMLEGRGSYSSTSSSPYPEDDYVWLGGRPVAVVRGGFNSSWQRVTDGAGTCSRLGDNVPCGTYFIVTDHIGKPVMSLNGSRQIVGIYDYQPGGYMNRQSYEGDTAHPYTHNTGSACPSTSQIASFQQRPANGLNGLKVDQRVRFHLMDTQSNGSTIIDYLQLIDNDTNGCLGSPIGGHHAGATVTPWTPTKNGSISVGFTSTGYQECPNGSGGLNCTCSSCTTQGQCNTCRYPYTGATTEWGEYREYASGTTPLMLPIRFPGQYYDAETDLHENWNRYYDPAVERYLAPDPMMPAGSPYVYAGNNPIVMADPTGKKTTMCYGNNFGCRVDSDPFGLQAFFAVLADIIGENQDDAETGGGPGGGYYGGGGGGGGGGGAGDVPFSLFDSYGLGNSVSASGLPSFDTSVGGDSIVSSALATMGSLGSGGASDTLPSDALAAKAVVCGRMGPSPLFACINTCNGDTEVQFMLTTSFAQCPENICVYQCFDWKHFQIQPLNTASSPQWASSE